MKAYGFKKEKKVHGDGCFLCTQHRKTTKTAVRSKAKVEARKEARQTDKKEQ